MLDHVADRFLASLIRDPAADEPQVVELRRRLDDFYAKPKSYQAFETTFDRSDLYRALRALLEDVGPRPRVLELGTGRGDFGLWARREHFEVHYEAQDVTAANRDQLATTAEAIHIGDISSIAGEGLFDLIFSTYVFEHVSSPRPFLDDVRRLLKVGGWHAMECPRYDLPGYVCPSLRHLSRARQAWISTRLALNRVRARLDGRERFWVNLDPSVFHTDDWYRDSDAVHLVSLFDVDRWHRRHGFEPVPLGLAKFGGRGVKGRLRDKIRLAYAARLRNR